MWIHSDAIIPVYRIGATDYKCFFIVDVIDCYRKQTLFLEDKGCLAKDDIISLDEYYDEKGRKVVVRDYNKEI